MCLAAAWALLKQAPELVSDSHGHYGARPSAIAFIRLVVGGSNTAFYTAIGLYMKPVPLSETNSAGIPQDRWCGREDDDRRRPTEDAIPGAMLTTSCSARRVKYEMCPMTAFMLFVDYSATLKHRSSIGSDSQPEHRFKNGDPQMTIRLCLDFSLATRMEAMTRIDFLVVIIARKANAVLTTGKECSS